MTFYYLSSPAEDSFDMTVPSASKLLLMYPLSFSLVPVTEATISLVLTALSSEKKTLKRPVHITSAPFRTLLSTHDLGFTMNLSSYAGDWYPKPTALRQLP